MTEPPRPWWRNSWVKTREAVHFEKEVQAVIRVLLQFASTVLVFLLLAGNLPGFYLSGWGAAVLASLVLGLVNSTLGFVLRVLSFPLILLTLGLFYFVVNAFVITLVAFLVPGFSINGFWPALIAAVVLSGLGMLWKMIPRGEASETP